MSITKTYLTFIFDDTNDGAYLFELASDEKETVAMLTKLGIQYQHSEKERRLSVELLSPLTSEQVAELRKLRDEGLFFDIEVSTIEEKHTASHLLEQALFETWYKQTQGEGVKDLRQMVDDLGKPKREEDEVKL